MSDADADRWLLDPRVRRYVFLSPHFDDVAFSCGGTVARLAAAGRRPLIVVVFAAAPSTDAAQTLFAREHDRLWGLGEKPTTSNAGRHAEELVAAACLGAELSTLPFLDAIYRGRRYIGNDQLFGAVHPDEGDLPTALVASARAAAESGTVRWFVPQATGRHVDHQLVFLTGAALARAGEDVWCYEDLPYSLSPELLLDRKSEVARSRGESRTVAVDEVWGARIDGVMAHRSQLSSAFGYVGVAPSRPAITAALDRFARGNPDDGTRRERFWALRIE